MPRASSQRKNHGPRRNAERAAVELSKRGPRTRKELAERLQIDGATLKRALDRLNEANHSPAGDIVYSVAPEDAQLPDRLVEQLGDGSGRTPEVLMLGRGAGRVVGAEVGHGHLCVAIGDANACLLGSPEICDESHAIEETSLRDTARKVATMVKKQLKQSGTRPTEIRGVAVSVPSPVDKNGMTLAEGVLTHYSGFDIPAVFAQALSEIAALSSTVPVIVENDVDSLARGEQRYGKAFDLRDYAVVKCSGGIGSAIVSNERLVRGRTGGGAGEIGHCPIKPQALAEGPAKTWAGVDNDPKCRCGWRGHLEAFAGGEAIVKRIRALEKGQTAIPNEERLAEQLDLAMQKALEGKSPYREVIDDAAALIGLAVSSLVHLFNPERVLIGGKLSEMGDTFLTAVQAECNAHGVLFGDVADLVQLGTGLDTATRRRIGIRGAVATALRKTEPRLDYA